MLQDLQIQASELVKIEITDASIKTLSFPQSLKRIEDGKLIAIQAYKNSVLPFTPEGKTVVNDTVFNSCFVTLKNKETDSQDMMQTPLSDLQRSSNSGIYERMKSFSVDLSQSKVEIPQSTVLTVGEVFLFRMIFVPKGACK